MQYLVTTSHALLLLDSNSHDSRVVHQGAGVYYGIADDGQRWFVAARDRLVSSGLAPAEERGRILVFDRGLALIEEWQAPFPLRDMHQVLWWRERLWITCSFDNQVVVTDGRDWQRWHPLGPPEAEPFDRNHFNSLTADDDALIVLAHNLGASELLHYRAGDLKLERRVALGSQAHNVWRQGAEWLTCSSGEGAIVGSGGFRLETGKFPRGVAHANGEILVGLSELAERNERDFTEGVIQVYTAGWVLRDTIALPRSGLVLDLAPAWGLDER